MVAEPKINVPVIGVLAQTYFNDDHPNSSYIAASYVKYLEAAGAQVVPVLTDQNETYYEHVFRQTNGCLFPGGGQNLTESSYTTAARFFMAKSRQAAARGQPYPIWATCLGFEQRVVSIADQCLLSRCEAKDIMSPLIPVQWKSSPYIGSLSNSEMLITTATTYNSHGWCLLESTFYQNKVLNNFFDLTALSTDANGLRYVAIIENTLLKWTAVQFHPEKAQFEFGKRAQHDAYTVKFGQESANYFVEQCRHSHHIFDDKTLLIYNYNPIYTGQRPGHSFEQRYIFNV